MRLIDADEIHWNGLADCPGKEYAKYLIDHLPDMKIDSRLSPKMVTCPGGWKGTRLTRYYCPQCKKTVRNDEAYCHKCGQSILFPKQEYDKENNKIWLNFDEKET